MAISLAPNGLQLLDHYCLHYALTLSVPMERAMEPDFWAHVGGKLKPFDRITLMAEDRAWMAELVVLSAGKGFAKLKLLEKYDLAESVEELEAQEAGESTLKVKFNGPADRWVVIRTSDNEKLTKGLTEVEARQWALNHQRSLAA